jgi:succinate-semialdehyde dehydrogenase / glutarate-semialdehyde dehydrogenase
MRRITSFVEGQWLRGRGPHTVVRDKYTDEPIAELVASTSEDVDAAVTSALRAFEGRRIPIADRVTILKRVASGIVARAKELAGAITDEAGATISEAAKEVERAAITLELTAEEATRLSSETVPLEGSGGTSKFAYLVRHPLGVVCAITAFNSPLNTPLHKIAPALAAGNSVVIKPPTSTPICCAILCDIFTECGLPPGWLNLVTGRGATVGEQLLIDQRIAFYHAPAAPRLAVALPLNAVCDNHRSNSVASPPPSFAPTRTSAPPSRTLRAQGMRRRDRCAPRRSWSWPRHLHVRLCAMGSLPRCAL